MVRYTTSIMRTYLRLLTYLKPHLKVFAAAISCVIAYSLLNGIQLGAIFPLADRIIADKTIPSPEWLPAWLGSVVVWLNETDRMTMVTFFAVSIPILFFLKGIFEFFQSFLMQDTAQRVVRDLRQALFDKYVDLSIDHHSGTPTGATMSRILYDTGVVNNSITEGFTDLVLQGSQVVMYLAITLAISWKWSLIIFVLLPFIAFPIAYIGKVLKKVSQQTQVAMGELSSTILESISGIRIVQAFRIEGVVKEKFAVVNEKTYRLLRRAQKRMNALPPSTEFIGAIGGAFVFWWGGKAVLAQEMSLGTFLVFLGAMLSLIRPFKRLARLHGINQQAIASAERIFEILDLQTSVVQHEKARLLPTLNREIVYENVSFSYGSKPVLREINLRIKKGETIAFVGPSGGGKTTFVNLLPRFYDPSSGRVTIDGANVKHVTIASLRDQIGLVTQETCLFNDTIRANIAVGKSAAGLDEIVKAAKMASAHEFISRLPSGYDTVIGDRGDLLSGGERQRLAIARALIKNPSILILDEATSQLDAESEHLISEAIERLKHGRTVLIIAHRLSTVRLAHRIVLIQEGRIIEQGSHAELLQKSPLYKRFCELQFIDIGVRGTHVSDTESSKEEETKHS